MAETVSNNISNAMNENYARREVNTDQQVVGGVGMGVTITSIDRAMDLLATSSRMRRRSTPLSSTRWR